MYNVRMHTIRGGVGRLEARIAEQVHVIRNRPIESLVGEGSRYILNGEEFSDVVIALPGNSVLSLHGMRDLLEEDDRTFFENCQYGRAMAATVEVETEVDRCYALSIPRVEGLHAATIIFHDFIDPESIKEGRRVTIVGGGDTVTPEDLLADFSRIFNLKASQYRAQEWKSAMPKFPPGRYRELASFLSRRRRKGLWFCGDYLMGPFIEAAVTTGQRAAEQVACRGVPPKSPR
jgi:protoporphyrinogen oxidase